MCGAIEVAVTVDNGTGAVAFDGYGLMINGEMYCEGCEQCGCSCFSENWFYDGTYHYPCVCFEAGTTPTFDAEIVMHPGLENGTYTLEVTVMDCTGEGDWEDDNCGCEGEEPCCTCDTGNYGCLCDY